MSFLLGLLGGAIGAGATIGSVWFAQHLKDLHDARDRLDAAGREAREKFMLLVEGIDRSTGRLREPWREEFFAFGRLFSEVDLLLVKLRKMNRWPWQRSKRRRYEAAEKMVQEFQERFGAAVGLLRLGRPLTEEAIDCLTSTISKAGRAWLDDVGTYDADAEIGRFIEHARYYMQAGIDASSPTD